MLVHRVGRDLVCSCGRTFATVEDAIDHSRREAALETIMQLAALHLVVSEGPWGPHIVGWTELREAIRKEELLA